MSFVVAGRSGGGGTRAGARAGQQLRPQRERARHRKGGHAARWPCSWPRAGGTLGAQAVADGVLWNLVTFPDLLLAFHDEGTLPLLLNASSCCRKVLHDGEARLHQARRKYGTVYIWSQSRKRTVSQTHRLCLRLASLSVSRGDIVLCSPTYSPGESIAGFRRGVRAASQRASHVRDALQGAHEAAPSSSSPDEPAAGPGRVEATPAGHRAPRVVPVEDRHEKEFTATPSGMLTYAAIATRRIDHICGRAHHAQHPGGR